MDIQTLTTFFMWCTLINGGLLALWTLFFMFTPDLVYRIQNKWFPLPRETYNESSTDSWGYLKSFPDVQSCSLCRLAHCWLKRHLDGNRQ